MKIVSITLVTLTQWTGGIYCLYISTTGSLWQQSTNCGTETQSVSEVSQCHYVLPLCAIILLYLYHITLSCQKPCVAKKFTVKHIIQLHLPYLQRPMHTAYTAMNACYTERKLTPRRILTSKLTWRLITGTWLLTWCIHLADKCWLLHHQLSSMGWGLSAHHSLLCQLLLRRPDQQHNTLWKPTKVASENISRKSSSLLSSTEKSTKTSVVTMIDIDLAIAIISNIV